MGLILRDLDKSKKPARRYRTTLSTIANALLNDECLIFLGSGASVSPEKEEKGLPTGLKLSEEMAEKCGLEWHDYVPLPTIAYYYEFYHNRRELNEFLVKRIGDPDMEPSRTIQSVVRILEILETRGLKNFVVTTNWDQLFEKAYEERMKSHPGVIVYRGGLDLNTRAEELHEGLNADPEYWWPTKAPEKTFLYKMHGCISRAEGQSLVVTEEDYINFLSNAHSEDPRKRLMHYLRSQLAQSTILFIGYGLADWNFRVLFKATAEAHGVAAYAVQFHKEKHEETEHPEQDNDRPQLPVDSPGEENADGKGSALERTRWEAMIEFWGKKQVDILNLDAAAFAQDLFEMVEEHASVAP